MTQPRTLNRPQKVILGAATLPMIATGGTGAWGTYTNLNAVFHREGTAAGIVAAGEGAVLVLALVLVGLTLLGQAIPATVRAGLWLLPATASITGATVAPTTRDAIVYAVTPMAMTVSAEGLGLLARRIIIHTTGIDAEAQRRTADTLRRLAVHQARADRHPWKTARWWSRLTAWRLMSRIGSGDHQLGSDLLTIQRERITGGADDALAQMLGAAPTPAALPPAPAPEPRREPVAPPARPNVSRPADADLDDAFDDVLALVADHPTPPYPTLRPVAATLRHTPPATAPTSEPGPSPDEPTTLPPADDQTAQIAYLVDQLRAGEQLTKSSVADLLGVSPATAGRRLKTAREQLDTGFYL